MNPRRWRIFLVAWMALYGVVQAREVVVSTAAAINTGTWSAGDTLVMRTGTWTDAEIVLSGIGTAQAPVVLRAEQQGQVILTGKSSLTMTGSYLETNGLVFQGTYTGTGAIVTFKTNSSHCRLTNTAILSYNLTDVAVNTKWVSLYGQDHTVDHCLFEGKSNMGTLLVVWLTANQEARHLIAYNRFGFRTSLTDSEGNTLNGQEIIRIGDSSSCMTNAKCVVAYNYFADCNGEIEIISNKSCENEYRFNTFVGCQGALTLRHGERCVVENNYFLGNGVKLTGGVRIIGAGHVVRNNYMEDLQGSNYRAAICLVRGKENSALNEYYQVQDATVSGNTLYNCKQAFCVNYHSSTECTLPPIRSTISNNTVYLDSKNSSYYLLYIAQTDALSDVTYSGNRANRLGKYYLTTAAEQMQIDPSIAKPQGTPVATVENTGPLSPSSESLTALRASAISAAPHKIYRHGEIWLWREGTYYDALGRQRE